MQPTISSKPVNAQAEALRSAFPETAKLFADLSVGLRAHQPWRRHLADYLDEKSYGDVVVLCREIDDLLKIEFSDDQLEALTCDVLGLDYQSLRQRGRNTRLFMTALAAELSLAMLDQIPGSV